MIAAGKAVPKLQLEHGLAVDRVYTGSFMTSLDMAGMLMSARACLWDEDLMLVLPSLNIYL